MRGVRLMVLLCALCSTAACGYMDSELGLDDRAYALTFDDEEGELAGEQFLELDAMHISGRGIYGHSYGCGGGGTYRYGYNPQLISVKPRIKRAKAAGGPVVIVGAGWNPEVEEREQEEAPATPTPQELLMEHTTQGSRYFIEHAKANIR